MTSSVSSLSERQATLLELGIIDIQGVIDEKVAKYVRECILTLEMLGINQVTVWISSVGGGAESSMIVYDLLSTFKGEVTGRVVGQAASMAAVVLQGCHVRECLEHSSIYLHSAGTRFDYDDLTDEKSRKIAVESIKKAQDCIVRALCRRTGKTEKEIRSLLKSQPTLIAEEALDKNLIDRIVDKE